MKTKLTAICYLLSAICFSAFAQGTAFTYQGHLNNGASPANGLYDFEFSLSNAPSGGSQVGSTVTKPAIGVTNGLFTTTLDFGAVFTGNATWLGISVRTNGVGNYVGLEPLQELTPTPYAIYAESASGLSGTLSASQLTSIGNTSVGASDNFFVGLSGNATTSGYDNTANGVQALFSNTSGYDNTANGAFALFSNESGVNNTALGYKALFNTTGGGNTAVGSLALSNNVAGYNNTAEGYEALENNNGDDNVAVGVTALQNVLSGGLNTAVGTYAFQYMTAGSGNIGIGFDAGYNLSAGTNNIYIGNSGNSTESEIIRIGTGQTQTFIAGVINGNGAGLTNLNVTTILPGAVVTNNEPIVALGSLFLANTLELPATVTIFAGGDSIMYSDTNNNSYFGIYAGVAGRGTGCNANTAIGADALSANTSGNDNTANGYNALYDNTSGTVNTAVGHDAMKSNQNGNQNVAVGDLALSAETSGNNNTAVGDSAGSSITTGSNNIDIGNIGSSDDSGVIRIGTSGTQTATYLVGTVSVPVLTITGGSDLAEPFNISKGDQPISEGEVVVIDEQHPGQLKLTNRPYDTRVAGVVSGANGIHPGIQMHQQGLLEGGRNVALTGRVYVQADTSNGAIRPGDLLTTSSTPGRAMRVSDHIRAQGAILGKAMTGLNEGQGMVLVLVTLQ